MGEEKENVITMGEMSFDLKPVNILKIKKIMKCLDAMGQSEDQYENIDHLCEIIAVGIDREDINKENVADMLTGFKALEQANSLVNAIFGVNGMNTEVNSNPKKEQDNPESRS